MSADPETQGLIASVLAAIGVGGSGFYRVAHKQSELNARVDRLDEDRRESERRMEEGRIRLEQVSATVARLDSKTDILIDLVRREK